MDTDTRKAMGINARKPINLPSTVCVEENSSGMPSAVKLKHSHSIVTVEDFWRIDDEWWRSEPVPRIYCAVILDSGRR